MTCFLPLRGLDIWDNNQIKQAKLKQKQAQTKINFWRLWVLLEKHLGFGFCKQGRDTTKYSEYEKTRCLRVWSLVRDTLEFNHCTKLFHQTVHALSAKSCKHRLGVLP